MGEHKKLAHTFGDLRYISKDPLDLSDVPKSEQWYENVDPLHDPLGLGASAPLSPLCAVVNKYQVSAINKGPQLCACGNQVSNKCTVLKCATCCDDGRCKRHRKLEELDKSKGQPNVDEKQQRGGDLRCVCGKLPDEGCLLSMCCRCCDAEYCIYLQVHRAYQTPMVHREKRYVLCGVCGEKPCQCRKRKLIEGSPESGYYSRKKRSGSGTWSNSPYSTSSGVSSFSKNLIPGLYEALSEDDVFFDLCEKSKNCDNRARKSCPMNFCEMCCYKSCVKHDSYSNSYKYNNNNNNNNSVVDFNTRKSDTGNISTNNTNANANKDNMKNNTYSNDIKDNNHNKENSRERLRVCDCGKEVKKDCMGAGCVSCCRSASCSRHCGRGCGNYASVGCIDRQCRKCCTRRSCEKHHSSNRSSRSKDCNRFGRMEKGTVKNNEENNCVDANNSIDNTVHRSNCIDTSVSQVEDTDSSNKLNTSYNNNNNNQNNICDEQTINDDKGIDNNCYDNSCDNIHNKNNNEKNENENDDGNEDCMDSEYIVLDNHDHEDNNDESNCAMNDTSKCHDYSPISEEQVELSESEKTTLDDQPGLEVCCDSLVVAQSTVEGTEEEVSGKSMVDGEAVYTPTNSTTTSQVHETLGSPEYDSGQVGDSLQPHEDTMQVPQTKVAKSPALDSVTDDNIRNSSNNSNDNDNENISNKESGSKNKHISSSSNNKDKNNNSNSCNSNGGSSTNRENNKCNSTHNNTSNTSNNNSGDYQCHLYVRFPSSKKYSESYLRKTFRRFCSLKNIRKIDKRSACVTLDDTATFGTYDSIYLSLMCPEAKKDELYVGVYERASENV